jgi:hypothetical protein
LRAARNLLQSQLNAAARANLLLFAHSKDEESMYLRILSVCTVLVLVHVSWAEDDPMLVALPAPKQPDVVIKPMAYAAYDASVRPATDQLLDGVPPEKQALIQQKLHEIDHLTAEIEQIRNECGPKVQIDLQFAVLDVDLDELERLDFHWPGLSGELVPDRVAALQKEIERVHPNNRKSQGQRADDQLEFVSCLAGATFSKVLADPKIAVLNRRSATFSAEYGPEVAEPDGKGGFQIGKCGTVFDVTPVETSPNVVHLSLRIKIVESRDFPLIKIANSTKPMAQMRKIDTTIEAKYGLPVVLDGLIETKVVSNPIASEDSEKKTCRRMMVVAVIAERVDPSSAPRDR